MTWQIKLLGSLEIKENGRFAPLMKSAKGCSLLAYLIITRQEQSREIVADLLWESTATAQSLTRLRVLLSRTRKLTPGLHVTRKTLSFHAAPDISVDFLTLDAALDSDDPPTLDAALQLYRGDLLDGFYLDNAPRFDEWLAVERERLRRRTLIAYRRLCESYAGQQAWIKGIDAAQRWLAVDELDEDALRELMRQLSANGQPSAALREYAHFQQRLYDVLGVEPEAETKNLAQQLKQLKENITPNLYLGAAPKVQIDLPEPGVLAAPGALPVNSYLPYHRNGVFTGREAMLLRLATCLQPQQDDGEGMTRAVVVTGMGGLGKTQLTVEFAYRYGRFYPGGVYWFNFAQAANVPTEVAAIGGERGMGLFRQADKLTQKEQEARVRQAWQLPESRLLIFDNCEDENLAAAWIPVTGGCRVLLTSRRSHWSPAMPTVEIPLDVLPRDDSVKLLLKFAPHVVAAEAQTIAAEVGDLPLALHLAGSFLARNEQLSLADYLTQLHRPDLPSRSSLLKHDSLQGIHARYSPTGHESNIARVFGLSLEQLDLDNDRDRLARRTLAHAACFAPGKLIPRSLLKATVAADKQDADAALSRLERLGLLRREGGDLTTIHRLVAIFSAEAADDGGAETAVENSIIAWSRRLYQKEKNLRGQPTLPAHLYHLTETALKRGDLPAARLSHIWALHLEEIADYKNAERYLQQTLAIQQRLLEANHPETAAAYSDLAYLYADMGDYPQAKSHYERALIMREQSLGENHVDTAETLNNLGALLIELGDYNSARQCLERALHIRENLPTVNATIVAETLNKLGGVHWYSGDFAVAETCYERALHLQRGTLGDKHSETAVTMHSLGAVYLELGDYAKAKEYLSEALQTGIETRGANHPLTSLHQHLLGYVHLKLGELELAKSFFEAALATKLKTLGDSHTSTAFTLNGLGELHIHTGEYAAAQTYLNQALAVRQDVLEEDHPAIAASFINLGALNQAMGNAAQAHSFYEKALMIRESQSPPNYSETTEALTKMGELLIEMGDYQSARHYLAQATAIHETAVTPPHRVAATLAAMRHLNRRLNDM